MGCALYTNNTTGATLNADAQIPFGSTIHRKGRAATLEGNEIVVRGGCNDYAIVSGTANLTAAAAGDVLVTVYVDNVSMLTVGATAAAIGDYLAIPFELVLKGNCCGMHRVTARTSAAVTVASFPVTVQTV